MVVRMIVVGAALVMGIAACSGDSSHEGQSCSQESDCGGNLTCQPVQGRSSSYCCPTPTDSSKEDNCHAAK